MGKLVPGVLACLGERYYKVAAEALRVVERLVGVMRPEPPAPMASSLAPHLRPLFDAVMKRFQAQDQDQEVGGGAGGLPDGCLMILMQ